MESFDLGSSGHCLGIHNVYVLPLPYREVQETVRLVSTWFVKDVVYYRADGSLYSSSSPLLAVNATRFYRLQVNPAER